MNLIHANIVALLLKQLGFADCCHNRLCNRSVLINVNLNDDHCTHFSTKEPSLVYIGAGKSGLWSQRASDTNGDLTRCFRPYRIFGIDQRDRMRWGRGSLELHDFATRKPSVQGAPYVEN